MLATGSLILHTAFNAVSAGTHRLASDTRARLTRFTRHAPVGLQVAARSIRIAAVLIRRTGDAASKVWSALPELGCPLGTIFAFSTADASSGRVTNRCLWAAILTTRALHAPQLQRLPQVPPAPRPLHWTVRSLDPSRITVAGLGGWNTFHALLLPTCWACRVTFTVLAFDALHAGTFTCFSFPAEAPRRASAVRLQQTGDALPRFMLTTLLARTIHVVKATAGVLVRLSVELKPAVRIRFEFGRVQSAAARFGSSVGGRPEHWHGRVERRSRARFQKTSRAVARETRAEECGVGPETRVGAVARQIRLAGYQPG